MRGSEGERERGREGEREGKREGDRESTREAALLSLSLAVATSTVWLFSTNMTYSCPACV